MCRHVALGALLISMAAAAGSSDDLARGVGLFASRQPVPALAMFYKVAADPTATPANRALALFYGGLCQAQGGDAASARRSFLSAFSLDPSIEPPGGIAPETAALARSTRAQVIASLKVRIAAGADAAQTALAAPAKR